MSKKYTTVVRLLLVLVLVAAVLSFAVACDPKTNGNVTLHFVDEAGNKVCDDITAPAGATITPPVAPTRIGYTFAGWYENVQFEGPTVELPSVMPAADKTYFAKYVPDTVATYAIELNAAPGMIGGQQTVRVEGVLAGEKVADKIAHYTPVNGEAIFGGWKYNGSAMASGLAMPAHDITLTAIWNVNVNVTLYTQKIGADGAPLADEYDEAHIVEPHEIGVRFAPVTRQYFTYNAAKSQANITPSVGGANNVTLYYDRIVHTISYFANAQDAVGEMEVLSFAAGYVVDAAQVNAECGFTRAGYRFAGWRGSADGEQAGTPSVNFAINRNYDLYAVWDREFTLVGQPSLMLDGVNKIYISTRSDPGLGKIYCFIGDVKKEGFLEDVLGQENLKLGTFYVDFEGDSVDVNMEISLTDGTYRFCGDEAGTYFRFNYISQTIYSSGTDMEAISMDGFGRMVYGIVYPDSSFQAVYYGAYEWDDTYSDWKFIVQTVGTQQPTGESFNFRTGNFRLTDPNSPESESQEIEIFMIQGEESSPYFQYDIKTGQGESYQLQLDGYGNARYLTWDENLNGGEGDYRPVSEGKYVPTDNWTDIDGEWEYVPTEGASFKFVTTIAMVDDEVVPVYLKYDESLAVTLHAEEAGNTATLTLNGYNGASYIGNGSNVEQAQIGSFHLSGSPDEGTPTLTLSVYDVDTDIIIDTLSFVVDFAGRTFKMTLAGLIHDPSDSTKVIGYEGTARTIEIPDGVTEIAANAFNYTVTGVNLISVTIPASVTKIGTHAFENENTLMTAIFLGETPVQLNFSNIVAGENYPEAHDPFRWPLGTFVIIVPEGCGETYRTAWAASGYTIMTNSELLTRPEFQRDPEDNAKLAKYNRPADATEANYTVTLPDDITKIGAYAFAGCVGLTGVNLVNVTEIEAAAFMQCYDLVDITAPNLSVIGSNAFESCTSLESVNLPAVTYIGYAAFVDCSMLTHVTVGVSLAAIGARAFSLCAIEDNAILWLEFPEGATAPQMELGGDAGAPWGNNVFHATEVWRASVQTTAQAMAFIQSPEWSGGDYNRMWVRDCAQSAIVGDWVDLTSFYPTIINGRAEFAASDVAYYTLDGSELICWWRDISSGASEWKQATGSYDAQNNKIDISLGSTHYVLVKAEGTRQYACDDGNTLSLNLGAFQYGATDSGLYRISVEGTFMGKTTTFVVGSDSNGRATLTGSGIEFDGIKNDVIVSVESQTTFTWTRRLNDQLGPFTEAEHGSSINILLYGSLNNNLYKTSSSVTGRIYNTVTERMVTASDRYTLQMIDFDFAAGTYIFRLGPASDGVLFTATVDYEARTFTYTCESCGTARIYNSTTGKVVVYAKPDGEVMSMHLLLAETLGETPIDVSTEYIYNEAEDCYYFRVNAKVIVYDDDNMTSYERDNECNGYYKVKLNTADFTCTIETAGSLDDGPLYGFDPLP